ncbi:hypothetical protein PIB30_083197 [Stylosanthes scabra]|uniref:Uncharacterized protein n=1 Tax=Stylosanthes scabra TaxID=79078 RepID=A0ABU6QTM0_9FABA|nr:hypothetical protein [Stylosanthes scabra]
MGVGDDIPLGDDFFTGAEHQFATSFGPAGTSDAAATHHAMGTMDPSMGFIATVSDSQFDSIVARYKIARDAPQVQQRHPPPSCTTADIIWIPPLTPPSAGLSVGGSAPLGHQFGTPPSWEYPPIQSASDSAPMMPRSQHPPQPSTALVIRPLPQIPHRQRQPPPCGTSSHLQHHPQ